MPASRALTLAERWSSREAEFPKMGAIGWALAGPASRRIISNVTFFKHSCQPRGYISEGKITIDIQSEQAATLHMITIRVILPQFTKIGWNRHRMGTRIIFLHYCEIWRRKRNALSGNWTRDHWGRWKCRPLKQFHTVLYYLKVPFEVQHLEGF